MTVPSPREALTLGTAVEVDPARQAAADAVIAEAASLRSVLGEQQYDEIDQHLDALPGRRPTALDRFDSATEVSDALSPGSRAGAVGGDAYMSEVAAELSHDLRVPLSSIVASVEMLEDELRGCSDRAVAELLERALRASDRMVRMLDQFMTSHASGRSAPLVEIHLGEVVRQLVVDSADLLDSVGAVVMVGELPVMRADPDEMYSLVQNLVSNAVKFARPGVPAVVRISARRSVDGWRVSVCDNGVGFADNSGVDVFSLFGRGTSAVAGHGIGLATVARIVAARGGRVGAASVAAGAEIWFELPDVQADR